jgi:hypothetical protein
MSSPSPSIPPQRSRWVRALRTFAPVLALGLLLTGEETPAAEASSAEAPYLPALVPLDADVLRPGNVLVLASWRCSFLRLDRVNEVALGIIETPLTSAAGDGLVEGWGQFNGSIRDEFNYHTYYVSRSVEDYRRALGRVISYMSREVPELMAEFYDLCDLTRETIMTVETARP